ncbi:MAG TPA: ATP-dependent DNA ligase [Thermoanaerobaculia bacterium]
MTAYRPLAEALEASARTRSRTAKVEALAAALRGAGEADLAATARLLSGSPFAEWEPETTSAGYATVARAAAEATGWDLETIGACAGAIGDLGEAVSLLLPEEPPGEGLTVAEAAGILRSLAGKRKAAEKQQAIAALLSRGSAVEAKYLLKTIAGGLRVGAEITTVEEAVAAAFGADRESVARARRDSGDIGETAVAARGGRLEEVRFRLFHPISFMLAGAIEEPEEVAAELSELAIEDKFDGIRAHAHKQGERVALFSRTLDDVTGQFPEIVQELSRLPGSFLLDGEILAWREERAEPFLRLQRRLGRKKPEPELLAEIPVTFIAYDCLAREGLPLFEEPWRERRRALDALAAGTALRLSIPRHAADAAELSRRFDEARARGNEGLMLKRVDSPYQAGKRGKLWRKWKKALATLDVVVTAVEQGHGKRAAMLSDYTFAVRDGERFVNIGKAYSGLTDEEIRRMSAHFRRITTERHGPVRVVAPEVVLEVSFDALQKSARHKSGFALRFPRILRLRPDKPVSEIATLEEVRGLYARLSGS